MGPPFLYHLFHVLGQRCLEEHLFLGSRVYEAQGAGVQGLAWSGVEGIAHEGFVTGGGLPAQNLEAPIAFVSE